MFDIVYKKVVKLLKNEPFPVIVNRSINQTLSRTVLTSVTVFIIALVLLIWGGPILFSMSLALTIGVIIGTYSSIYIASPLTLVLYKRLHTRKA